VGGGSGVSSRQPEILPAPAAEEQRQRQQYIVVFALASLGPRLRPLLPQQYIVVFALASLGLDSARSCAGEQL
jgi:hypothetical protein